MSPTFILTGFLLGALPRPWYLLALAVVSIASPLLLSAAGDRVLEDPANFLGEATVVAVNFGLGILVARRELAPLLTLGRSLVRLFRDR